jgi:hypothetical protein
MLAGLIFSSNTPLLMKKKNFTYVAEASQHPGNRVLGSIDTGNEVHAGTDPVERPHDRELHSVLSSLGCSINTNNVRNKQITIILLMLLLFP